MLADNNVFLLLITAFQGAVHLPLGIAFGAGLPLVIEFFAPAQGNFDLDVAVLQVDPKGHQGKPFFLDLGEKL